jgi:hypothetical protein
MSAAMTARIFKPAKTAMQSGFQRTKNWMLVFETACAPTVEPLMGWTAGTDMCRQIRMAFDSCEEAVDYANRNDLAYMIVHPKKAVRQKIAYSDNFRADRLGAWTH